MGDKRTDASIRELRECIRELNMTEFSTADVIRKLCGQFRSDKGTPGGQSPNALLGKRVKQNELQLGITEIASKQAIRDDDGNRTMTSRWRTSAE